ncbi:hypothetical protein T09_6983 [Trichinella sp. T9]|nr:hypothetical protein T09_6983 [Trichinella sp. T9]
MPVDEVKKKHRGFFDHVCNGIVYVCRWNVVAAWQLHREFHQESSTALSHLDFRRDITTHLQRAKPRLTIRTGRRAHPPETLRINNARTLS